MDNESVLSENAALRHRLTAAERATCALFMRAETQDQIISALREELAAALREVAKWKPPECSIELGFMLDKPLQGPRVRSRRNAPRKSPRKAKK